MEQELVEGTYRKWLETTITDQIMPNSFYSEMTGFAYGEQWVSFTFNKAFDIEIP